MGTKLSKAPVCFTLAQMRFNSVLVMEPFVPQLQEAFRKAGFPDYAPMTVKSLDISPSGGAMEVREISATRLVFRNKAQTAAVLLDPGAMTYELTDYPVFEEFSQVFLDALEIVHRHRSIEYCDRIGMRMLDAVQPHEGETLDQYVVPQALGFTDIAGVSLEHQQSLTESLFIRDGRTLLVRTARVPQGIVAPPDLAPLRLKLDERFVAHKGASVMLDCDSFSTGRVDYSVEAARTELAELKAALSKCFRALVTPYALRAWK
jgi:uncharacterized protein (TIGR04255 family)